MINIDSIIGTIGLSLILLAFVLNLFHYLNQRSRAYNLLNIFGSGLLAYYSWILGSIPFLVLQIVWAILSLVKLFHVSFKK